MPSWQKVTDLASLKRRKKCVATLGDDEILVLYAEGRVYALNNTCIHKGKKLARGLVFKGHIICPGHQWAFDLRTGWVDEWAQCQPTYAVRVEDGEVYVDPEPKVYRTKPCLAQEPERKEV